MKHILVFVDMLDERRNSAVIFKFLESFTAVVPDRNHDAPVQKSQFS